MQIQCFKCITHHNESFTFKKFLHSNCKLDYLDSLEVFSRWVIFESCSSAHNNLLVKRWFTSLACNSTLAYVSLLIMERTHHITMKCTYMHVHVNKLFKCHYIILKGAKKNGDLCRIAKTHVEVKSNQLENVFLTCNKLTEYLSSWVNNHSWLVKR